MSPRVTNWSDSRENSLYFFGVLFSLIGHLVGAAVILIMAERRAADALRPTEVFTVTLEGGDVLGGINQVPDTTAKSRKTLELPESSTTEAVSKKQSVKSDVVPKNVEKALNAPSVVEDPQKLLEQKRAEEKKIAELKKKSELEAAAKKRAEEQKQKAEAEKKRKAQQREQEIKEKAQRDKKLSDAIERAANRYRGESTNAGGTGFGAASLGGKGMGGGTLASLEFIAYRNQLEQHIKSGWHWLKTADRLQAQVIVTIMRDGQVQDVRVVASSGNSNFDDSIIRAVYKASPVPPAPEDLYTHFREVRVTFDSEQ